MSVHSVWIESITTSSGGAAALPASRGSRRCWFRRPVRPARRNAQALGAHADLLRRLLAGEIDACACPRLPASPRIAAAASICRCRDRPPSRMAEPCASPPPITRSNSPMPVWSRGTARHVVAQVFSAAPDGRPRRFALASIGEAAPTSSASVFHSPQAGQRPAHRGLAATAGSGRHSHAAPSPWRLSDLS